MRPERPRVAGPRRT